MVGAVGIEPITQSNSAAPEHRRAALLRRVCKGHDHPRLGAAEQPIGCRVGTIKKDWDG
jgi:hypothetical protein